VDTPLNTDDREKVKKTHGHIAHRTAKNLYESGETRGFRCDKEAYSQCVATNPRDFTRNQAVTGEIAFHEKTGGSQVESFFFLLNKVFSSAE
jgi:hypothetical protein